MCYPNPGPRCSHHAKRELTRARLSEDTERIRLAQLSYDLTPAGIKDLHAAGKHAEAEFAAATRRAQLAAYRASRNPHQDLATTISTPQAADPDLTGYSPLEQVLLIEDLDPASINKALDALETRERARVFAYARTH